MKMKEESEKAGLKLHIQKTKIMSSGPIIQWQIVGEKSENSDRLFSWAPKPLQTMTAGMKLKHLLTGRRTMTNPDNVLKSRDITF